MSTVTAAVTSRVPRTGLIALAVLVVAFVALIVVRSGVLGGSNGTETPVAATPAKAAPAQATGAKPLGNASAARSAAPTVTKVVLLPGLPASVAKALRTSRVAVVSLYVGQAQADRRWVTEARNGARDAGAGFVAVNLTNDRTATSLKSFVGATSSPAMLVVRRPGRIVTQISGPVEAAVVRQAAHNAGARNR